MVRSAATPCIDSEIEQEIDLMQPRPSRTKVCAKAGGDKGDTKSSFSEVEVQGLIRPQVLRG